MARENPLYAFAYQKIWNTSINRSLALLRQAPTSVALLTPSQPRQLRSLAQASTLIFIALNPPQSRNPLLSPVKASLLKVQPHWLLIYQWESLWLKIIIDAGEDKDKFKMAMACRLSHQIQTWKLWSLISTSLEKLFPKTRELSLAKTLLKTSLHYRNPPPRLIILTLAGAIRS